MDELRFCQVILFLKAARAAKHRQKESFSLANNRTTRNLLVNRAIKLNFNNVRHLVRTSLDLRQFRVNSDSGIFFHMTNVLLVCLVFNYKLFRKIDSSGVPPLEPII